MKSTDWKKVQTVMVVACCVLTIAYCICEYLQLATISAMNKSLVVGDVHSATQKAYVYYTIFVGIVHLACRYGLFKSILAGDDVKGACTVFIPITCISTLVYDLPVATLNYLVAKCRDFYLVDVQVATAVLHIITVISLIATVCIVLMNLRRSGLRRSVEKLSSLYKLMLFVCVTAIVAACVSVIALRIMMLKNSTNVKKIESNFNKISVVYLKNSEFSENNALDDYELGRRLSASGGFVTNYTVMTSLNQVTQSTEKRKRTEGSGKNTITIYGHIYHATLACSHMPTALRPNECFSGFDELRFLFRYDVRSGSLAPYGRLHYNCAVAKTNSTHCDDDCSSLNEGWALRLLQVDKRTDTSGRDASRVTSPWRQMGHCGSTSMQREREDMNPCSAWRSVLALPLVGLCLMVTKLV